MNINTRYGNWALITGASSGIGRAFAEELVKLNVNCIIISNNKEELMTTKEALLQLNSNVEITSLYFDLTNVQELNQFLSSLAYEPVRIVINCAGIGEIGYLINKPLNECIKLINLCMIAPFMITYFFTSFFYKKRSTAAIINVSSANAEIGYPIPFSSLYSPLKTFVKLYTESLSYEMKPFSIDILNVSCGPTATQFQSVAKTRTLFWCETPRSVAVKSLKKLGKTSSIITNPISRSLIFFFKYLPAPKRLKLRLVAWYFGKVLGGREDRQPHV